MTVVEAIKVVMAEKQRAMSAREIYEAILRADLYTFRARNPAEVVSSQLRRHCSGLDFPSASKTKHFILVDKGRYSLLEAPTENLRSQAHDSHNQSALSPASLRQLRNYVLTRFGNRCSMCGRSGPYIHLDVEHFIPKSKGGADSLDNLYILCRSCNVLKHTSKLDETQLKMNASASYRLERDVAKILHEMNFSVLSGATGPDGGADMVARIFDKQLKRDVTLLVECKWISGKVSTNVVAGFASKLEHYMADYGLLVTNAVPSPKTLKEARSFGVSILPFEQLRSYLAQLAGIK